MRGDRGCNLLQCAKTPHLQAWVKNCHSGTLSHPSDASPNFNRYPHCHLQRLAEEYLDPVKICRILYCRILSQMNAFFYQNTISILLLYHLSPSSFRDIRESESKVFKDLWRHLRIFRSSQYCRILKLNMEFQNHPSMNTLFSIPLNTTQMSHN